MQKYRRTIIKLVKDSSRVLFNKCLCYFASKVLLTFKVLLKSHVKITTSQSQKVGDLFSTIHNNFKSMRKCYRVDVQTTNQLHVYFYCFLLCLNLKVNRQRFLDKIHTRYKIYSKTLIAEKRTNNNFIKKFSISLIHMMMKLS